MNDTTEPRSADIINLWVKRREREREESVSHLIWACECGGVDFKMWGDGRISCWDCGGEPPAKWVNR